MCKLNPTIETTLNKMFHGCLQSVHYFQGLASIQSLSQTQNVASSLKDTSKAEILCYCFDSVLDYAHIVYPEHIFSPLKKYLVLYRLRIILEICYCFVKGRLNSCIRADWWFSSVKPLNFKITTYEERKWPFFSYLSM